MSGVSGSQLCGLQASSSVLPSVAIEVALVHTQNGSELSSVTIKVKQLSQENNIFKRKSSCDKFVSGRSLGRNACL